MLTSDQLSQQQHFQQGRPQPPPTIDSEADYWLQSDADFSITDMWTESGVAWNELGEIHEDYTMAGISTPQPQTPPSSGIEVLQTNVTAS